MIIPVRCFSCGKPVAHLWEEYKKRIAEGENQKKVLEQNETPVLTIKNTGLYQTLKNIGIPSAWEAYDKIDSLQIKTGINLENIDHEKAAHLGVFHLLQAHNEFAKLCKDINLKIVFSQKNNFNQEKISHSNTSNTIKTKNHVSFDEFCYINNITLNKHLNFAKYCSINWNELSYHGISAKFIIENNQYNYDYKELRKHTQNTGINNFKKALSYLCNFPQIMTHESKTWFFNIRSNSDSEICLNGREKRNNWDDAKITTKININQLTWLALRDNYANFLHLNAENKKKKIYANKDLGVTAYSLDGKNSIFINGIKLSDQTSDDLLYSYDLEWQEQISPYILTNPEKAQGKFYQILSNGKNFLKKILTKLVAETNDLNFAKSILEAAHKKPGQDKLEYPTYHYHCKNKKIWLQAFNEMFEDQHNPILASKDMKDNFEVSTLKGGYTPIHFHPDITAFLKKLGLDDSEDKIKDALKNYEFHTDLNSHEQEVLNKIINFDKILTQQKDKIIIKLKQKFKTDFTYPETTNIKICTKKDSQMPDGVAFRAKVKNTIINGIGINRIVLNQDLSEVMTAYLFEKSKHILQGCSSFEDLSPKKINSSIYTETLYQITIILQTFIFQNILDASTAALGSGQSSNVLEMNTLLLPHKNSPTDPADC